MAQPNGFTREFIARLQQQARSPRHNKEVPAYDYAQQRDVDLLVSSSTPLSFRLGTGASLFASALLPAILSAQSEVLLVTCFWAPSKTLTALRATFEQLAAARRAEYPRDPRPPPLRVRICVSSVGLWQKLLHTSSPDGYTYPPKTWVRKLGLPDPAVLEAGGIDLRVKSLFFLPFSIIHPKFLIVDRKKALVPSCNVSWEAWLEGCVELRGAAVDGLLDFYVRTWDRGLDVTAPLEVLVDAAATEEGTTSTNNTAPRHLSSSASSLTTFSPLQPMVTLVLPSPHHRNPQFRPFPWQQAVPPPPTPLNIAVVQLIERAVLNIFIHTPSLSSPPVITSLTAALGRGVDVYVVTNRNMMILEQLATAGTTTQRCVRRLIRQYRALPGDDGWEALGNGGTLRKGRLRICYFNPLQRKGRADDMELGEGGAGVEEPVKTHLKLTIVDGILTLLGSGNMDRASWYTSQEVGVLFHDGVFGREVRSAVDAVLEGRVDLFYDSGADGG